MIFPHSTRNRFCWQEGVSVVVLLAVLTLVAFWPQLVGHRVLYWGDIGLYFAPMLGFLHDNLRVGRIPLWNPHLLCGAPYVGNPQTWPISPFSVLLNWLPAGEFINITIGFHVWLAGIGMYLFLRHGQSLDMLPALLGSIVLMFGGQFVSKEQFPNMLQAAAYLPLILWLLGRLLKRNRAQDAFWLGIVLGLQLLCAHAQITLLIWYLALAYGVFDTRRLRRSGSPRPNLWLIILSVTLGVGLAMAQLLPTLELVTQSWRQNLSLSTVNRFYLPVTQLANFVLPTLHGHPSTGDWTARGNFWETCCYVGVVPLCLSARAAFALWRSAFAEFVCFWAGVFLFGTVMALGKSAGLYSLAYWVLPGFRSFHDPARCLLWATFALSVLAAFGLHALCQRVSRPRLSLGLGILLVLAAYGDLAYFDRSIYPLTSADLQTALPPIAAKVLNDPEIKTHQARFLTPDSARIWNRFTTYHSYRADVPDYQELWYNTLASNLPMSMGVDDAFGYEPVPRWDSQAVLSSTVQSFSPTAGRNRHQAAAVWAGMFSVQYLTMIRTTPPEKIFPGLDQVRVYGTLAPLGHQEYDSVTLCYNKYYQMRARLTQDFRVVGSQRAAIALMNRSLQTPAILDLSRTTVIAGPVSILPDPLSPGPDPIKVTDEGPDQIGLSVASDHPTLLVVADTLSPGWTAVLDEHPVPILSANGCLRAVEIPHWGSYVVRFRYKPTSFLLGLYITLLVCGIVAGYFASSRISQRV